MNYPPPIPGLLIAGVVACGVAAFLAWAFVWMYHKVDRDTPEARHLYRMCWWLGLILTLTVLAPLLPLHTQVVLVMAIIQLVLFIALACELYVRIWLLRENQHRVRVADSMLKAPTTEEVSPHD